MLLSQTINPASIRYAAAFDSQCQLANNGLEGRVSLLLFQDAQTAQGSGAHDRCYRKIVIDGPLIGSQGVNTGLSNSNTVAYSLL